jgi:ubiquitin carboxyl-terminal hydrolase 34
MDAKMLSAAHKMDHEPNLPSRPFLEAYGYLIREQEHSHIGRNLRQHYGWDWDDEVALMTEVFHNEGGTLKTLTQLIQGLLRLPFRTMKTIDSLVEPCRLASKMVVDASKQLHNTQPRQSNGTLVSCRNLIMQGYELFTCMSAGIDSIIERPVTHLTSETASNLLDSLYAIYCCSLEHDNDSTRRLLEETSKRCPQIINPKDIRSIPSTEWRLAILSKFIMSTQMQLRVLGVTNMCQVLLNLYTRHKLPEASKSPVLQHFSNLIIQSGIIEHLVSTASHPEIIIESNNILGFLMVTKRYNSSHAATIWQTITTSQDPRIVEATLRMIKKSFNLQDYNSLLLVSEKAIALPLGAFTMTMRDFLEGLFKELEEKARQENIERIDEQPYDLCVRLIRESSISTPECPAGDPVLQNFAAICFRGLLAYGPWQIKREQIYRECIDDMAARSPTAPGSLCVINILVRQNKLMDIHHLAAEHDLTRLVIQELASFVSKDRQAASPAITALRDLVDSIIVHEPSTISKELGRQLWDLMVGRDSKSVVERDTWWHILNNAVKTATPDNVFIAACFKDYLPTLPPACFTAGALQLATEAIRTWLGDLVPRSVAEDQTFDSIALEQLWRMVLLAPPHTIDKSAIDTLVATYLQSEILLSLPRAKARGIHLALVNRCLGKLADAAVKLRAFGKNDTSFETGSGMAIVASETEYQEQETIFARSLAVLREFLQYYQSSPHFSTPIPKSQPANISDVVQGEPFTVKYQSFTSTSQTEILSLSLGTLNTAASLFASLQKATGFQNYKVFCGGIELDPDEMDVCKSLDDLNIKGLVLVQQREGGDGSLRQPSSKTSLELEIMKHLDELWGYLRSSRIGWV